MRVHVRDSAHKQEQVIDHFLQRVFKENSSFHNSLLEKLLERITSPSNLESMKNLIFFPYSLLKASQSTLSL